MDVRNMHVAVASFEVNHINYVHFSFRSRVAQVPVREIFSMVLYCVTALYYDLEFPLNV